MRPLVGLALLLLTPAAPAWALSICDSSTAVSLVGLDTASGRALFAVPAAQGPGWLLELDAAATRATAYPDMPGRYAGSIGPGPVVAAHGCGDSCVQPLVFRDGAFAPLGEPVHLPAVSTVATTYDAAGHPWLVAHGPGASAESKRAWAFRLEGEEWRARGQLEVTAIGQPQAQPARAGDDAITSGSGRFSAAAEPASWVAGLPSLPPTRRGQLVPLAGDAAAYLSADGVIYFSDDRGQHWRRSTWTPWSQGTTGLWRQGKDFSVDLPVGVLNGDLVVAWFDRRRPEKEQVVLAVLPTTGAGKVIAETAAAVHTQSDEELPMGDLLAPRAGTWILFSGCAATAEGSGLVLKVVEHGELSAPRLVPIVPGAVKAP